ncbi:alkaline phosphatase family protein [Spirilliplanes yamanashiensis]|nr:alkaline phosphatase family protein [Spirilliplanes yamanashiensis]MDP9819147.1 uncharacterized membrane protein YvlD (DUF360 family) [Spirilliplanes yamanashiensis]
MASRETVISRAMHMARLRTGLRMLRDWRFTVTRVRSLLRALVTSFVVLTATLWLAPGIDANGLSSMLGLVVVVSIVGALLRPLLLVLATVIGGWFALLLGICVQAIVMYVSLRFDDRAHVSVVSAFVAAWVAVAIAATVNWVADAGTDDAFVSENLRLMHRVRRSPVPDGEGLLIIQLDGLAAPLLKWSLRAGNLPNLGRWLRLGTHSLGTWHTGLPATTPGAQAGLLHGNATGVPAFRWYEKDSGRLLVTNRPRDAAELEQRISDGRGLLRDGGVSISNIFSGDAPTSLLTVSRASLPRRVRGYASFATYGLARGVVLGIGEIFKELHQARVQRRRDVQPRVRRGGAYLFLRPATNVLLRDLNVSLIAEQMALGAPVVFCDFVDYDEVAHHAGPARPESLHALDGLDRMLGTLQRLSVDAARRYHIVVLSDHGQSQGATFRQRYGEPVERVVQRLYQRAAAAGQAAGEPVDGDIAGATGNVERWGPVNTLLTDMARRGGPPAAAARAAARGRTDGAEVTLGPADEESREASRKDTDLVVAASGNLAMVYLNRHPGRLRRDEIERHYPGLIGALATHPGIGLVVVADEGGPVAVGGSGWHRLADGAVGGQDPLAPYGPRAADDLRRHQTMDHLGDLVLVSLVDPDTEEVAAFEELVGSHGGLGGWQTDGVLLHPAGWERERDLVGPEAVHRQLLLWLRRLGLRDEAADRAEITASADVTASARVTSGLLGTEPVPEPVPEPAPEPAPEPVRQPSGAARSSRSE